MKIQRSEIDKHIYEYNGKKFEISATPVDACYNFIVKLTPSVTNVYEEEKLDNNALKQDNDKFSFFRNTESLIKAIMTKLNKKELKVEEKGDFCEIIFELITYEGDLEEFRIKIHKSKKLQEQSQDEVSDFLHTKLNFQEEIKNLKEKIYSLEEVNKNLIS